MHCIHQNATVSSQQKISCQIDGDHYPLSRCQDWVALLLDMNLSIHRPSLWSWLSAKPHSTVLSDRTIHRAQSHLEIYLQEQINLFKITVCFQGGITPLIYYALMCMPAIIWPSLNQVPLCHIDQDCSLVYYVSKKPWKHAHKQKDYCIKGHSQYILWATDPDRGFCALSEEKKF